MDKNVSKCSSIFENDINIRLYVTENQLEPQYISFFSLQFVYNSHNLHGCVTDHDFEVF